jgi:hypothetical protein
VFVTLELDGTVEFEAGVGRLVLSGPVFDVLSRVFAHENIVQAKANNKNGMRFFIDISS